MKKPSLDEMNKKILAKRAFLEGKTLKPITLTPEQIKTYLAQDDRCPVCGSPEILNCDEYYHDEGKGDLPPYHHMQDCQDCFSWWLDEVHPQNCKHIVAVKEVHAYRLNSVDFILED